MADSPPTQYGGAKSAPTRFQDRTISITLGYPKCIFGLLFGLLLLVWAFIFGVMIGRGHNPEETVPKLAKVMPSPEKKTELAARPDVIKPQDLGYRETLKSKEPAREPKTAPQQAPPKEESPSKTAPPVKPETPKAEETPKPVQQNTPPSANDETVYDFLYQVAASNNKQASETLRKKLDASGLTTRIVQSESNGTTWNRILVVFRGTPDDTRMLRDKLATLGITQAILREKTPVVKR